MMPSFPVHFFHHLSLNFHYYCLHSSDSDYPPSCLSFGRHSYPRHCRNCLIYSCLCYFLDLWIQWPISRTGSLDTPRCWHRLPMACVYYNLFVCFAALILAGLSMCSYLCLIFCMHYMMCSYRIWCSNLFFLSFGTLHSHIYF